MLSTIDIRGQQASMSVLRRTLPRAQMDVDSVHSTVQPIVEDIKARGTKAALEYGEKFDGIVPESVKVPASVVQHAADNLDPKISEALRIAIERVRQVHAAQKPKTSVVAVGDGALVREEFLPVARVGLYVPGGNAVYPSSVIMNVVPAQEAGVESLVVTSPPQKDCGGWPHPTILAACYLLGVEEIWAVGGAQAVALMAYGDSDLEPVDMITGPGNIFVTAAKRCVRGVVGIDSEAGPTEIAIIADETANPVYVAYDLISQAEHDVMAASVLITPSQKLATTVDKEIEERYGVTLNADRVAQALKGEQSGIVLVDDIEQAIDVANAYAAEHLEIHTKNDAYVASKIRNAGAVFVGEYAPVPLGDYAAGSNHVLPTSGSATYSSGLSTYTFLKPVHFVEYTKEGLTDIGDTIITLADAERLPAHGEAIKARLEDN